jgi:hypothetical protein
MTAAMMGLDKNRCFGVAAVLLVAAALLAAAIRSGSADDAGSSAVAAQPAPEKIAPPASESFPTQPPPVEQRGFLNGVGTWWDQALSDFTAKMKAARDKLEDFNKKQTDAAKDAASATADALKDAAQATKDAASAVVRLPNTRVFEFNERCAMAANGAPDCGAAATNACRQKGFNSGQPIDVRTQQECPTAVLLSGRAPAEGECPEATFILRAVCQ